MLHHNAESLITSVQALSERYPFGRITILGPLDALYDTHGPVIRFRPPDAARLQYLVSAPPVHLGAEEQGGARGSRGEGREGGEGGESARALAGQDGYGVAVRCGAEDETERILQMVR